MAKAFLNGLLLSRSWFISYKAAPDETMITAIDNTATRLSKRLRPLPPLGRPALHNATTRVSKPNGAEIGDSSGDCAADRNRRSRKSLINFLSPKFCSIAFSFSGALETLVLL